jgi:hypothetical protein
VPSSDPWAPGNAAARWLRVAVRLLQLAGSRFAKCRVQDIFTKHWDVLAGDNQAQREAPRGRERGPQARGTKDALLPCEGKVAVAMCPHPTAVWIDHHEARIFRVEAGRFDASTVRKPHQRVQRHPSGPTTESNHSEDMHGFFQDLARALEGDEPILIVGPSNTAKLRFLRHVHRHEQALEPKIAGVETVEHPADGQLVIYAGRYFGIADRVS